MPQRHISSVPRLELPSLAKGMVHRLEVEIVEDATGRALAVPILVARGREEGPVLGLTAAVHGNEVNGIPTIHHLFRRLEVTRLRGTVIAVLVANLPGFHRHNRRYLDMVDLNDVMPGREEGPSSEVYANRLFERVVKQFEFLIDLHTASSGRVNTLYARADMTAPKCARIAQLLRPKIIAHKPKSDGTLRGAATEHGIPAVTLEIGDPSRFQPEFIRTSHRGIRAVMAELGMLKTRPAKEGPPPLLCSRSYWVYTDHGGLLTVGPSLAQRVREGEPLGELTNIYGDVTATYTCPEDGVIIGKSRNPIGFTGARIAHLGIEAKDGELPHVDVELLAEDHPS